MEEHKKGLILEVQLESQDFNLKFKTMQGKNSSIAFNIAHPILKVEEVEETFDIKEDDRCKPLMHKWVRTKYNIIIEGETFKATLKELEK